MAKHLLPSYFGMSVNPRGSPRVSGTRFLGKSRNLTRTSGFLLTPNNGTIDGWNDGRTWPRPREVPLALTGDRYTGKYGPDGRLFISFQCISPTPKRAGRPFEGDWAGWVGTYEDIVAGRQGQCVVRLQDNTVGYDTTYPGVEVLPEGTFVVTTYGHWDKEQQPYILSVRFTLQELDAKETSGKSRQTARTSRHVSAGWE